MANPNQIGYGTTYPSDTTQYWQTGDIIINTAQSTTGTVPYGWVCVANGYAGTWSPMFVEPTQALTTTATSGTLSAKYRLTLLNPATTGTYSLPDVSLVAAGFAETFKNIASGSTTLTPLTTNGYDDAAAITLAQHASVTLLSSGGTTWYKQS